MTSRCASSNTTSSGISSPAGAASAAGGISRLDDLPGADGEICVRDPRAIDRDAARLDQRLQPRAGQAAPAARSSAARKRSSRSPRALGSTRKACDERLAPSRHFLRSSPPNRLHSRTRQLIWRRDDVRQETLRLANAADCSIVKLPSARDRGPATASGPCPSYPFTSASFACSAARSASRSFWRWPISPWRARNSPSPSCSAASSTN